MAEKYLYDPVVEGHSDFVRGCEPDIRVQRVEDLDVERIAASGVTHVLFDWDLTLVPNGDREPSEGRLDKITEFLDHPAIEAVHIATSNDSSHIPTVVEDLWRRTEPAESAEPMQVFGPFQAGSLGTQHKGDNRFWRRILSETGTMETPEAVLMIGDSVSADIYHPQRQGMQTAQVDRFMVVTDIANDPDLSKPENLDAAAATVRFESGYLGVDPRRIDERVGQYVISSS